jgi:hypothetical protein
LLERRIRHHLGRARAAALSRPARTKTLIALRVAGIGEALERTNGSALSGAF